MKIGDFEVTVNGESGGVQGYITLPHKTEYTVEMMSNCSCRCDAEVTIDGEHVGTWRIAPYGSIDIERPVSEARKFTFLSAESEEGGSIASGISKSDRGLITVKFTPEVKTRRVIPDPRPMPPLPGPTYPWNGGGNPIKPTTRGLYEAKGGATMDCLSMCTETETSAGVTGLGADSDQSFVDADHIVKDYSRVVEINLRLVCGQPNKYAPLKQRSNPIPAPIG